MPVSQQGQLNTTALVVPNLYVQIVPPSLQVINGLPTNVAAFVGTASWGPVNSPVITSPADYTKSFGPMVARKYDMGTLVATAALQGASNLRCIRVTDGTDTAASIVVQASCITFTSKYTGTLGNSTIVTVSAGSKAGTYRVVVSMPNLSPEVFDNIGAGLTGNAVWVAIASAINTGISGARSQSDYIVATAGAGTAAPTSASYTLTGGTDGSSVTPAMLVGSDTTPRTGMYAIRGTGASIAALADCDDTTTFTTQSAFGLSEGVYMVGVSPAGTSISTAVSSKSTAGIDNYAFKWMHGDWCYFADPVSQTTRMVSPQGYMVGLLANLSPEQSSLNKPMYGIVGTQKSMSNQYYSDSELQALVQAGFDVITNPIPAGNVFGGRVGHNSSTDPTIYGDNYTRMTNYIAYTLNAAMGKFVGKLQGRSKADPTRLGAKATMDTWLETLKTPTVTGGQGMIDDYSVQLDKSNNSDARIAAGYMQADVKVAYLGVVEKFLVNLEGGQSVKVTKV